MEQPKPSLLKQTILHSRHKALGGKMVDFCGWDMPVQYQGIIPEHLNVRQKAGLFDVSHMGRVEAIGKDAERFMDYLSTNKIVGKPEFSATYTVWPNEQGGCVDDVIVYKISQDHFFAIVNAGNRQNDLLHLQKYSKDFDVQLLDHYSDEGILALQGPLARKILAEIFPEAASLKHMRFLSTQFQGIKLFVSCTGYTGEDGFEIYAPLAIIPSLWDRLMELGKPVGLMPIGLGARDTLRLEKGYALYGHEISETISSIESVSAWTVKGKDRNFVGKAYLDALQKSPDRRSEYGAILVDPGIARANYEVFKDGQQIGIVTSGTHSPSLNKSIAIILVKALLNPGDTVDIQIRQHLAKAQVVPLPFL